MINYAPSPPSRPLELFILAFVVDGSLSLFPGFYIRSNEIR